MFPETIKVREPVYLKTIVAPTQYQENQNYTYPDNDQKVNNFNNINSPIDSNKRINNFTQYNNQIKMYPEDNPLNKNNIKENQQNNNNLLNRLKNSKSQLRNAVIPKPNIENGKIKNKVIPIQKAKIPQLINQKIPYPYLNDETPYNQIPRNTQIIPKSQTKNFTYRQIIPNKRLSATHSTNLNKKISSPKLIDHIIPNYPINRNNEFVSYSSNGSYQPSPSLNMNPLLYSTQMKQTNKFEDENRKPRDSKRSSFKMNDSYININNKYSNNQRKDRSKKKSKINKLKLNEEILLRNQRENLNKDLDIKTHFEIEVTKERYLFEYKKVLKIAMPLLSHYEMPIDCEYKSPILSPDGQYLSCIGRSKYDIVYIWDLDDLYWYKYKFSSKTNVDSVVFTPDSKMLLIIYRQTSPVLYNLSNGKKVLEFEKNGEENNREGIHSAFTVKGTLFGYTTNKSFTLWSMKSGKIKKQIKDESPIKLLFGEYIVFIKKDLTCQIKEIKNLKIFLSFKLKGIQNINEILDSKCSPDMSSFIYVIKKGIIKYIFKDKQFKGLQKFQPGVEKASISDDCRFVVKTNMRNLTIYDIEKGDTIGTILKEKFNEFKIDFNNEKLIVIDNLCINIHDYTDGGIPEQFVWLNKNPNKFLDAKFSHDFKFLFALIDKNCIVAYDLNTGLIIKKWQNVNKNWTNFSVSENTGNKTATNSNLFLVKVWNYMTGREDATFYGFDSYSFHFSFDGKYLACGAKNGPEAARIWDIDKGTFGSFPYIGNNSNFHTIVHLTSPEPKRLICCSIDQQPLIFDTNSKELLYKCECLYRFEEIYEIISDQKYDIFIVKGRDVKKREIGLMYRMSDGILLEQYENYIILELSKDNGVVISKCENVNGGKLTSTDLKNLSEPILNDFQIQTDKIKLLNDNKTVVVITNSDEDKIEYCLMSAEDGGYFGKINFVKKTERNSENYITVDPIEKFIYFRYFEFLSPQESRNFIDKFYKKHKFN